jgi:hypothetical protein
MRLSRSTITARFSMAKISSWNALASFATDITSSESRMTTMTAPVPQTARVGVLKRPTRANPGDTTLSRPIAKR